MNLEECSKFGKYSRVSKLFTHFKVFVNLQSTHKFEKREKNEIGNKESVKKRIRKIEKGKKRKLLLASKITAHQRVRMLTYAEASNRNGIYVVCRNHMQKGQKSSLQAPANEAPVPWILFSSAMSDSQWVNHLTQTQCGNDST
jgi:hypothetical protein